MTATEIKIELLKRGITQQQVADELKLDQRTINTVIHSRGSSLRVAQHLSDRLGIPVEKLFPGRYEKDRAAA